MKQATDYVTVLYSTHHELGQGKDFNLSPSARGDDYVMLYCNVNKHGLLTFAL